MYWRSLVLQVHVLSNNFWVFSFSDSDYSKNYSWEVLVASDEVVLEFSFVSGQFIYILEPI
jgi:hypothetical protein